MKAHWKNQFRLLSPAEIASPEKSRKYGVPSFAPTEKNSALPMKPFSGTLPYAKAQPNIHQPSVLTQQFSRFFSSTDCANPARQQPHSNIANPACMNITIAPHRMSHMCDMAASCSIFKDSIMVCNSAMVGSDVLCPAASIARMRPSAAED